MEHFRRRKPILEGVRKILVYSCECYRKVVWSRRRVSNPQPSEWKSDALPIELRRQIVKEMGKSPRSSPAWEITCGLHFELFG